MAKRTLTGTEEELLARAIGAGLEKAARLFPEDVLAAAQAATTARNAFLPPDDPAAEPWPPMRIGRHR